MPKPEERVLLSKAVIRHADYEIEDIKLQHLRAKLNQTLAALATLENRVDAQGAKIRGQERKIEILSYWLNEKKEKEKEKLSD